MKLYQLVSIKEKTGVKTLLTNGKDPLTHMEACMMKFKFTEHKHRVILLEAFKPGCIA